LTEPTPVPRRRRAPLTPGERAHLAGLTTVARHGTAHMATIGQAGQDALSRRIAAEWGIPEDAPDYLARITAARRAYFARLRRARA
jgi:hypothetical protein